MRRIIPLIGAAALVVVSAPSTAVAAPSNVRLSIYSQAEYVSPTTIQVHVSVVCPQTFGPATVMLRVEQAETGGVGNAAAGSTAVPCTGSSSHAVVEVVGGPFTVGRALASGSAFAGGASFDSDTRRIQIVL